MIFRTSLFYSILIFSSFWQETERANAAAPARSPSPPPAKIEPIKVGEELFIYEIRTEEEFKKANQLLQNMHVSIQKDDEETRKRLLSIPPAEEGVRTPKTPEQIQWDHRLKKGLELTKINLISSSSGRRHFLLLFRKDSKFYPAGIISINPSGADTTFISILIGNPLMAGSGETMIEYVVNLYPLTNFYLIPAEGSHSFYTSIGFTYNSEGDEFSFEPNKPLPIQWKRQANGKLRLTRTKTKPMDTTLTESGGAPPPDALPPPRTAPAAAPAAAGGATPPPPSAGTTKPRRIESAP